MSSLMITGDLKYLIFIFIGVMVSILILGYHKSPQASPQLGAKQLTQRNPTLNPNLATMTLSRVAPVSTEQYVNPTEY